MSRIKLAFVSALTVVWLLITALWFCSFFVDVYLAKRIPGRWTQIESFKGHLMVTVYTSNVHDDWARFATWKWIIGTMPTGAGIPGEDSPIPVWRKIVGLGYYRNARTIAPALAMRLNAFSHNGASGTLFVFRSWWLMYHLIWVATGIVPAVEMWLVWKRNHGRRLRGFPVGKMKGDVHNNIF